MDQDLKEMEVAGVEEKQWSLRAGRASPSNRSHECPRT